MRILGLLLCPILLAAATPLEGTWKLNRARSSVTGEIPSFIKNDTMIVKAGAPGPAPSASHIIAVDGRGRRSMYGVDISPDQRTLTLTRIESYEDQSGRQFHTVLILDKQ